MLDKPVVYVVDDDEESRNSVCALISSMGLEVRPYASAEEFLSAYQEAPGCLVTDLRMPGMSGLELQEALSKRGSRLPVIIISAYARTKTTVRAMRGGAVTILDKPYDADDLWDAIREALKKEAWERDRRDRLESIRSRMAMLSAEQRSVLELLVAGNPNKSIAQALGLGLRTVESRRHDVLRIMQAESIAELVRMVVEVELRQQPVR